MITAIVSFPLPRGTTLEGAKALFEKSAPNYAGAAGLIRKYYLYDAPADGGPMGGGVYLWDSREAAERQYSQAWQAMIAEKFGVAPDIRYFETPVIVDNAAS